MGLITYLFVVGVGGTISFICPPLLGAVAWLLGFTSTGVGVGTLAASAQAYVGNVAAGSIFAALQAAAMSPVTP